MGRNCHGVLFELVMPMPKNEGKRGVGAKFICQNPGTAVFSLIFPIKITKRIFQ